MTFSLDPIEEAIDDLNKKCERAYDDANNTELEADALVEAARTVAQAAKDAREAADEAKDEAESLYEQLADIEEELSEREETITELRDQLRAAASPVFLERLQKLHGIIGAMMVEYESIIGDSEVTEQ